MDVSENFKKRSFDRSWHCSKPGDSLIANHPKQFRDGKENWPPENHHVDAANQNSAINAAVAPAFYIMRHAVRQAKGRNTLRKGTT